MAHRTDFNFETTLGGETKTKLLGGEAAKTGATLNLWYAGRATRSGVSIDRDVARFERTGQIGYMGFAKLLVSLGLADQWLATLKPTATAPASIPLQHCCCRQSV